MYGCRNFIPDKLHSPVQVGYGSLVVAFSRGLSHVDNVYGGFLVSHDGEKPDGSNYEAKREWKKWKKNDGGEERNRVKPLDTGLSLLRQQREST